MNIELRLGTKEFTLRTTRNDSEKIGLRMKNVELEYENEKLRAMAVAALSHLESISVNVERSVERERMYEMLDSVDDRVHDVSRIIKNTLDKLLKT